MEAYLAVRHQAEQEDIAAQSATNLALLWSILQFAKLDETTKPWLHSVVLEIERGFRRSEDAAFNYVQGAQWSVDPLAPELEKIVSVFPADDVELGMRVLGPIRVKQSLPAPEADAMAQGKLNSTGVGVKHVMNGGRGQVQAQVDVDAAGRGVVFNAGRPERFKNKPILGYARFTQSVNPCYFCALLASQGAVYVSKRSFDASNAKFVGKGRAKVHDHCMCSLRPVFSEKDKMDARAKYFLEHYKELYNEFYKATGDQTAMNAYRSRYVPPPPYKDSPELVDLAAVKANLDVLVSRLGVSAPVSQWYASQVRRLEAG